MKMSRAGWQLTARCRRFVRIKALALVAMALLSIMGSPFVMPRQELAQAAYTLPPAPWGEFTPFYGAAPCIPDFQDVGIFSPADAKADAMVDKLLKKRLLGEDDVADIRKFDEQDRDRRTNRNFQGNLSYRMQMLYTYFEGDSRAKGIDPSVNQTTRTTTIPSVSPMVRPSSSGSSTLYGGSQENVHDLNIRRMRLQFSGCSYQDMQFHIELHADNQAIGLRDLDITWTKYPWANVMIGQIKMPNSRERQLSSGAIHFPERAFSSQGYTSIGREMGVQLSGMDILDLIDYKVMAASGFGFNKAERGFDDTANLVYANRVTLHPFGRVPFWAGDVWNSWSPLFEFSITNVYAPNALAMGELNALRTFDLCNAYGASTTGGTPGNVGCWRRNSTGNEGFQELPLARGNINPNAIGDWKEFGFDTTFMYRGFSATFEYHNATYTPNNGNPNLARFPGLRHVNYNLDLGYMLVPRFWEVLFRYQFMDINTSKVYASAAATNNLTSTDPTLNRRVMDARWYEFGTVFYLSGDHRHKLGLFGHIRKEGNGTELLHNNGGSINLQMAF